MLDLLYKLEKLELTGTPEKKDIVVMQFLEAGTVEQVKSLQDEVMQLKDMADWKNVVFLMLPSHIRLSTITDEDLDELGLCRK